MLTKSEDFASKIFSGMPICWQGRVKNLAVRTLSIGIGELHYPAMARGEQTAAGQLSVVVPVHNAFQDTSRCLSSLERFCGNAEVILVDDGSTDEETTVVLRRFALRNAWTLVRNAEPRLHSGACGTGAHLATRPILCFLNSDTIVTQHSWALCVKALLNESTFCAVGPRTSAGVRLQTDRRAALCRFFWTDGQIFWYARRLNERYGKMPPREISRYVSGAAIFVRRVDWERVGGFDGCREHYGNDVDLCEKLKALGGRLAVCDGSYIHHLGGRSPGDAAV